MRLSQIDLNLFVVFEAIYTKRNLTRAAEVLCITQPAVSNALKRLRKSLNDPLFVSTAKGMVPTPVADNIYRRVNEALQLMNSSIQETDLFIPAQAEKVFRVSMNDLTESVLLPRLMEKLQREAPNIKIESYYTARQDVPKELSSASIDLAIDAPLIEDPQVKHHPLLDARFVCMVRKDHPWVGDTLTMEDYLKLDHIHVSSRRTGLGMEDAALKKLGYKRNITTRVQHYMVAPLIALRSDLALTGSELLLRDYDAKLLPLPFQHPNPSWHLYWHRSSDQDQANSWLRKQIIELLAKL